jgi:NAD(P) transhydrogenase subunit alpha
MDAQMAVNAFTGIYIFMLAAFAGWVLVGDVPAILHTPLMSGSNFVHGIVVVGGLFALINATNGLEQSIGFATVLFGAGNAAGGYAVTVRMLAMFKSSDQTPHRRRRSPHRPHPAKGA